MRIAASLLPGNALIDTGVFFRYLGDRPDEPASDACRSFCAAMVEQRKTLFVAAPTLAEVTRHHGSRLPRQAGVVVVPFDDRAAELLGLHMPMAKIHSTSDATGISRSYLKYDSMIVACALRARTPVIVSLDSDHVKMVKDLKSITVRAPGDFKEPQTSLFDPEMVTALGLAKH